MLNPSILSDLAPHLTDPSTWSAGLQKTFDTYQINTPDRMHIFLAQTLFESNYFTEIKENLNYSENGLLATFPTHFTSAEAAAYARQPEKIANRVYANRMGNGDEASGDGWRYRGRGLIQLTGKENYQDFANATGMNLADMPPYLETPEGACMSAGWYWSTHGLNALADGDEFTEITLRINGGYNGLAVRKALWTRVVTAFQTIPPDVQTATNTATTIAAETGSSSGTLGFFGLFDL